jgi:hypothetical protein
MGVTVEMGVMVEIVVASQNATDAMINVTNASIVTTKKYALICHTVIWVLITNL